MSGELFDGRYRLIELLGEGGMGRVWRARDEALNRHVAVKQIVFPHGMDTAQRRQLGQRAIREARAAAKLTHPGVITVHDVLSWEQVPVIVMELIDGPSLAQVIAREGRLPPVRVARIGAMLLEALGQAHAAGIVHRDLKPANVLLAGERVVITDFGIAHLAGEATLTASGTVIGTPAYMAPEQARGLPVTPAWDLWSLGATLYAAVEGHPPYTGTNPLVILAALLTLDPPPAPRHAGTLTGLLAGLLRKDPGQRMTLDQATQALTDALMGRPAPPWGVPFGQPLTSHTGGHTAPITALAVGQLDGTTVAVTGSEDHTVRVWDLAAGRQLGAPLITGSEVRAVAVGQLDGTTIAVTISEDRTVRVWDLAAGRQLGEPLTGDRLRSVLAVAVGQLDGTAIAVTIDGHDGHDRHEGYGAYDGYDGARRLRVWDLAAGRQLGEPLTDYDFIGAVAVGYLNSGRTTIAVTGSRSEVRVWDLATRQRLGGPVAWQQGWVWKVAVGQLNGRTIAVTSDGRTVRGWDVTRVARSYLDGALSLGPPLSGHIDDTGHAERIGAHAVAVGQLNSRTIAVTSGNRAVRVWDLATGQQLSEPLITGSKVNVVAVGQVNGRAIAVTGGGDRAVRVWDLAAAPPPWGTALGEPLTGHTAPIVAVAVGQLDGTAVAVTGGRDETVRVWDLATGRQLRQLRRLGWPLPGGTGQIHAVAVGQLDGTAIAVTGGRAKTARVWDLATGQPLGEPLTGHTAPIVAVAVGQLNGAAIAVTSSEDRTVRVWDLATGRQMGQPLTHNDHTERVYAVAVGQLNGRTIAVVDGCGGVEGWDLATGRPLGEPLIGHTGPIGAVAMGRLNGRTIAVTGGGDHTVRVWDLGST